ncbi:MAG: hypothetical protein HQK51_14755 [Oligoflexia bacterium]|nr:hypothetical protein [Oligoflexia bacterium]
MRKKILLIEFWFLFGIAALNALFFYYKNSFIDNFFYITSETNSFSLIQYFVFSLLSIVSYFTGLFVVPLFFIFAFFYSTVFSKRENYLDVFFIFSAAGTFFCVGFFYPNFLLGYGIDYLVRTNISFYKVLFVGCFSLILSLTLLLSHFENMESKLLALKNLLKLKREKKIITENKVETASANTIVEKKVHDLAEVSEPPDIPVMESSPTSSQSQSSFVIFN